MIKTLSGTILTLTSDDTKKIIRAANARLEDFSISFEDELKATIIQYIDYMGDTRILKNRYGKRGLVV